MIHDAWWVLGGTTAGLLLGAGVLHALPRCGGAGRAAAAWIARAPGLDLAITWFVAAPLIAGPIVAGWWGLLAAAAGQCLAIPVWTSTHELAHPDARRGPRIVKVLNRLVGRWRNHLALWIMLPAAPMFWLVRVVQYGVYPALTWLVGLPKYPTGDWVNLSRQKFDGLVGHDLIWCLYCDWMTGLWALGSEMLRNIESLWCPIRFAGEKKCENCRLDFPDVGGGETAERAADTGATWVDADADMAAVVDLLESQYDRTGPRGWFAHPTRVTINGRDAESHEQVFGMKD